MSLYHIVSINIVDVTCLYFFPSVYCLYEAVIRYSPLLGHFGYKLDFCGARCASVHSLVSSLLQHNDKIDDSSKFQDHLATSSDKELMMLLLNSVYCN